MIGTPSRGASPCRARTDAGGPPCRPGSGGSNRSASSSRVERPPRSSRVAVRLTSRSSRSVIGAAPPGVRRRAAHRPRATPARRRPGTARDPPPPAPHRDDVEVVAREQGEDVGRGRRRRGRGARSMPASSRSARSRVRPRRRRTGRDEHPFAAREPQRGSVWCETPWWRWPRVGERDPQARDRVAAEPGRRVEDRTDLDAAEPEPGAGARRCPGPSRRPRRRPRRRGGRPRARSTPRRPRSRRRTRGRT